VEDRLLAAEQLDRLDDVDALPEQMARIEVRADLRSDRLAQSEQRRRVVDDEAGVHLEGDLLDAVPRRERRCLGPVRDDDVVPLPLEDLEVVVGPRARHPVRILGALVIAGAS
jgi:hypothetical protein